MRLRWFLNGVAHLTLTVMTALLVAAVAYGALLVALLSVHLHALQ